MRSSILVLALITGCASTPPLSVEELRAQAPSQPAIEVCRGVALGDSNVRVVAAEEMERRKLDCSPYIPLIQAQAQADAIRAQDRRQTAARMLNGLRQSYQVPQLAPPEAPPVGWRQQCSGRTDPLGNFSMNCR